MMKLLNLTLFLSIYFLLSSCSKNDSMFDRPIQKDRGHIKIINSDGFLGAVTVDTTLDVELTLKATGGLGVTNIQSSLVTSDPITFKDGVYPGTGGTCATELSSGQTCTIIVTYAPTNLASHAASLNFTYSDIIGNLSYNFSISADSNPILTFEYGSQYDFGNKFVGSSTDLRIRISNTGKVNAENLTLNNLYAPFSYKGGTYPGVGGSCSNRILIGMSCDIIINYSPTANGQHLQDISLNYLNAARPESNTLNLLAWGFNEAQLILTSANGDNFGTVPNNNNNTKTFTITHSGGDVAANLISLSTLPAPFSRVGGSCGTVLTIDQGSCTIIIALNSATSGTWNHTFNLSYFNGTSTVTLSKTITGITRERPVLSLSHSGTFNFANTKINQTTNQTFTLTYVSGELAATEISLAGFSAPFSRTGGTCTTTLSSGSCTIILGFTPTTYSSWGQSFSVNYNNTISTTTAVTLSINGKSEGRINPNTTTLSYSSVVTNQTRELTLRLDFVGGSPVTNISTQSFSGPYQYSTGSFPGSTSNSSRCTTNLSGGSCYLFITFAPVTEGTYNGHTLVLNYNNGVDTSTITISLSGIGSPAANLGVQDKNYPDTPMNSAGVGPSLVRVTNSSTMTASSMSVVLPTGFSYRGGTYPGLSGNCSSSLAGNGFCNLDIVFTPLASIAYASTLTVNYHDGTVSRSATSTLTGTGITSNELYLSFYDQVTYANIFVGRTPYETKIIRVGHGGSSTPATISSLITTSSDFTITNNSCPSVLSGGATCNVTVAFSPQSAGLKTSALQLIYDSLGLSSTKTRTLTGTGVAPAVITPSSSPLAFGSRPINASYDLDLTLTKTGYNISSPTGTITGSGFTFKGGSYPGTGGTCPTTGSFPASCKVVITFTPIAIVNYNGTFTLNYSNGYQVVPLTVSLTGSGFPTARLLFSSSTYSFGQVIQTQTSERTLTVTNNGAAQASALSYSTISAPFRYKGGSFPGTGGTCSNTLNISGSCVIVLEFAPTAVAVSSQTLTISYLDGYTTSQTSATITGEGLAQAILSISDGSPYQFGTVNVGASIDKSFTITNSGSVSGTTITGSFTSAFSFKGGTFPGTGGTCTTSLSAGATCTIILSFTPTAATSYSGNFTLNYNDGLRLQTELKELRGTGSPAFLGAGMMKFVSPLGANLSQFNNFSFADKIETVDLNKNGFEDELESFILRNESPRLVLRGREGLTQRTIYKFLNHFPNNYHQGFKIIKLQRDYNHDGVNDILLGIYKNMNGKLNLVGYDIICQRKGQIIFRYLNEGDL